MKLIFSFSFLAMCSCFVFTYTLNAACLVRDYSSAHLANHPQQEVRSITFSVNSFYGIAKKEIPGLPEGSNEDAPLLYFPYELRIHILRNNVPMTLTSEGYCNNNFYIGRLFNDTATCYSFKNGAYTGGTFTAKQNNDPDDPDPSVEGEPKESHVLFNFNTNLKLKILGSSNEYTTLKSYDFTSRVFETQSRSLDGDMSDFVFERSCPKSYLKTHMPSPGLWNEAALDSVRLSLARPTVTARNLYHLSVLLWDIKASFLKKPTLLVNIEPEISSSAKNIQNTMAFAAHYFLKHRYKKEPGNNKNEDQEYNRRAKGSIDLLLDRVMLLGSWSEEAYPKAKELGLSFAKALIDKTLHDGSREEWNYNKDPLLTLINKNHLHVNLNGIRTPSKKIEGASEEEPSQTWNGGALDFSQLLNVDHWVQLFVPGSQDQNGNDQDYSQSPLTLHWGKLPTFSDLNEFYDDEKQVYFYSENAFPTFENNKEEFIKKNLEVARKSLIHNPIAAGTYEIEKYNETTGEYENFFFTYNSNNPGAQFIDISPRSMGNNHLGTDNGMGYGQQVFDEARNKTYTYSSYPVKAADFYRSLAEFWADGPSSETPPGHWNTLASFAIDKMIETNEPFRWNAKGETLSREDYELRLYLALNGALNDAAIVAWGLKGAIQGSRPISSIRYFAALAERDEIAAQEIVALSNGLLKMDNANFVVNLTHYDFHKDDFSFCTKEKLNDLVQIAYSSDPAVVQDKIKKGIEVKFEHGEKDQWGNYNCYAKFTERKLWIQSWNGLRVYESPDGSNLLFPVKNAEDINKEALFSRFGVAGSGWILAENWNTYQKNSFVTPPFPGFISGHSTFSRAAAEVLTYATGSKFFPGGIARYNAPKLEFENGPDKEFEFQWATYFDAADQSGASRVYGGIHASFDDYPGRKIGSTIGKKASLRVEELISE